jgi:GTP cyclohydrolase I
MRAKRMEELDLEQVSKIRQEADRVVAKESANDYIKESFAKFDVKNILEFIGENTEREGLKDTPKRYIKFLNEFLNPAPFNLTTFESEGMDEMVVVKDIPFYSLCEHHLAPFFGTAAIAYIPNGRIVGLSKLPRVLDQVSRKLQNQERITKNVAGILNDSLAPKGVAVVLNARHMCMEMRGIKSYGASTTTSSMTGVFKTDINCRQEFLNFIK